MLAVVTAFGINSMWNDPEEAFMWARFMKRLGRDPAVVEASTLDLEAAAMAARFSPQLNERGEL